MNDLQKQIIKGLINKYSNFDCIPCAQELKDYLMSKGIHGKLIQLNTRADLDDCNSFIYDDTIGIAISETGYHEGICLINEEEEIVFDYNHAEGISKELWLSNLQFFGKIHLGQSFDITEISF